MKNKKTRKMTNEELTKNVNKPKFYEKHKNIMDQTLLEPHILTFYLHENMLNHFTNISDISNCLEVYSEMDFGLSSL